jgi:hypothetical protein
MLLNGGSTSWRVYLSHSIFPRHIRHKYPFLRAITGLRVVFLLICWFIGWIYLQLLYRYGSISPLATFIFTSPYDGRIASDYPPESHPPWRPPFRVVVSLTTTPKRLDKIMNSVQSLVQQSLVPDQIYVNVPKGPMKRHPEISYDEVEIPKELLEKYSPLVKVNRCVDDGPATKLLGSLRLENDPTTLIITLDDDFEYPKRLVEALAWEAIEKPNDALGVCGWGMIPISWHPVGVVPAYVPYFMRPRGRYVDILQACCGNAYRRGFFSNLTGLAAIPNVCITVDDVWIAGYLRLIENRPSAIISKRLDPKDPSWKEEESASKSQQKMKLSSHNHKHQIHYQCVHTIETIFKKKWTRANFF